MNPSPLFSSTTEVRLAEETILSSIDPRLNKIVNEISVINYRLENTKNKPSEYKNTLK